MFTSNKRIDFSHYDLIVSPSEPLTVNKPVIYGPHFSVFPNSKLQKIPIGQKALYIQPSDWAKRSWGSIQIPIHTFSFPVDTIKFSPSNKVKNKVMVYTKRRDPKHVEFVCNYLKQNHIDFEFFDYVQRYKEEDYLRVLQESKYGIMIDAHESQGFAIQEALSCNVPLLVWNVKTMNQEWKSRYSPIPCTSIPYWDSRCGEVFYEYDEFIPMFQRFTANLQEYKPREYILEHLSVEPCAKRFQELIKNIL